MTRHALEEEQPGLLVEDGIGGPARVTRDVLLDVAPQHVLDVFLLEPSLDDQLIVAVNSSAGSQLWSKYKFGKNIAKFGKNLSTCKEKLQEMFWLTMQHFSNFNEVGKCCFLASDPDNLGWSHDELLLFSRHHLRVLVSHDAKDPLEQLIILIVTVGASPWIYKQK